MRTWVITTSDGISFVQIVVTAGHCTMIDSSIVLIDNVQLTFNTHTVKKVEFAKDEEALDAILRA